MYSDAFLADTRIDADASVLIHDAVLKKKQNRKDHFKCKS